MQDRFVPLDRQRIEAVQIQLMETALEILRSSVMITGLVIMMMLLIEYLNTRSQGRWIQGLRKSSFGQVLLGTLLGLIPGCMGGFATVSLYTHGVLGFGALIAMMVASSGDEAFVMLATIPDKALLLFGILAVVAMLSGLAVNALGIQKRLKVACDREFELHGEDLEQHHHHTADEGGASWRRIVLIVGEALFIAALGFGLLSDGDHEAEHHAAGINLLDEQWMNVMFAIISLFVLYFTAFSPRHFVEEHLWNHVVCHHLLRIFLWTAGTLAVIEVGLHFLNLEAWIQDNIPLMILFAVLVGIIPESGPHMLFITLFAGGMVPFSVLLASSVSQDGHAGLPLLAETKSGFLKAKLVNIIIALIVGFAAYALGL